jgi:hypothetical protein
MVPDNPCAASVNDCPEGAETNAKKLNVTYAGLSEEDVESRGESGSIANQTESLTKYAERSGLTPIVPIRDDGFGGTSWARPGRRELTRRVDAGEVGATSVKIPTESGATTSARGCFSNRVGSGAYG